MNPLAWMNPGVWLALLLALGSTFGAGYWHRGTVDDAKQAKAENARITAEQVATFKTIEQNTRVAQQQAIDNRKVSNAHQSEIAAVRAEYERPAGRLRVTSAVCDQFAAAAKTDHAGGTNAVSAGTVALPESTEHDLRRLARDADEVTATARALQDWVRKNGFAGD